MIQAADIVSPFFPLLTGPHGGPGGPGGPVGPRLLGPPPSPGVTPSGMAQVTPCGVALMWAGQDLALGHTIECCQRYREEQ